jgi:hypothetical protein
MQQAVVSETMKGIRPTLGTAQPGKEPLLTADILKKMLDALDDGLIGCRDRVLLLVGFTGGFRRSDMVELDVDDVSETADGRLVRVRRSKTDPEAKGMTVALPYGSTSATCPVRSYRAWIAAAGFTSGPAFRSVDRHSRVGRGRMNAGSVARLIKLAAEAAVLDPAGYAGHSLRAGFATQAFLNGAAEVSIMRQTRHKSLNTLPKYPRPLAVSGQSGSQTGALTPPGPKRPALGQRLLQPLSRLDHLRNARPDFRFGCTRPPQLSQRRGGRVLLAAFSRPHLARAAFRARAERCAALKPFFCFLVTGPQAIIIPRIATALVVRMLCYGVLRS